MRAYHYFTLPARGRASAPVDCFNFLISSPAATSFLRRSPLPRGGCAAEVPRGGERREKREGGLPEGARPRRSW